MTGSHTKMMRDEIGQDRGMNITNACSPAPAEDGGTWAATKTGAGGLGALGRGFAPGGEIRRCADGHGNSSGDVAIRARTA